MCKKMNNNLGENADHEIFFSEFLPTFFVNFYTYKIL